MSKKNKKLQFDFSDKGIERLDELKKHTNATTRAEVIRRALSLYDWVVIQLEEGGKLKLEKKDETITLKLI